MPSATEWNRHVDAAEFVLRNLAFENGTPRRGTPGDTNFVTVLNSSGADRVQGELLEFTGLATGLTDLAARHLMLNGGSPTLANGFGDPAVADQERRSGARLPSRRLLHWPGQRHRRDSQLGRRRRRHLRAAIGLHRPRANSLEAERHGAKDVRPAARRFHASSLPRHHGGDAQQRQRGKRHPL
jgi:hypothetical protein